MQWMHARICPRECIYVCAQICKQQAHPKTGGSCWDHRVFCTALRVTPCLYNSETPYRNTVFSSHKHSSRLSLHRVFTFLDEDIINLIWSSFWILVTVSPALNSPTISDSISILRRWWEDSGMGARCARADGSVRGCSRRSGFTRWLGCGWRG